MSIRKELNGTYTVIAYSCGKQVWRRGIKTKKEAIRIELDIKSSDKEKLARLKVDDLMSEFIAHQKSMYSITTVKTNESRYNTHVKPYIGKKYLDKVDSKDMQCIIYALKRSDKSYSTVYINKIREFLSNLFSYALDMGYISRNPIHAIKKLKEEKQNIQFVTLDDYLKIHQVLKEQPMYQAFIELLFFSGMRLGEARALLWSQVDFKKNTILVNAHVVDKGGKRRVLGRKNNKNYSIIIPKNIRHTLEEIYKIESKKDDFNMERYVFGFYDSWSYNRIRRMYKKALQEAHLFDYKIHALRHGYASLLANSNASIQELAVALGDTLEVTINTYTHMYDDVNQKINDRVNQIISDSSFFM